MNLREALLDAALEVRDCQLKLNEAQKAFDAIYQEVLEHGNDDTSEQKNEEPKPQSQ